MRRSVNKYRAEAVVDASAGHFDSKREYRRWVDLNLLARAGKISQLTRQQSYGLTVTDQKTGGRARIGAYVADFVYFDEEDKRIVVEDAKGFRTPLYRWKKKHFEAEYGIPINEV